MKKSIIYMGLVLVACSSDKDERFCNCLLISDELNLEATKYGSVSVGEITDQDVITLKTLMYQKDSICEPYEILGGEELLKKKEACK